VVCVLPVPGVQQQTALQVLADGKQRVPVTGYSEGMPLDPRQHRAGQDDVLPADSGRGGEVQHNAAKRIQRHVEQVTAVDIELGAQLVQFGEQPLGQAHRQARDLNLESRLMLARGLDHHDIAAV